MDEFCKICSGALTWRHDHRPDNTGVDDGPPLSGYAKRAAPKSPAVLSEIRARAWATRRKKYGTHGHR